MGVTNHLLTGMNLQVADVRSSHFHPDCTRSGRFSGVIKVEHQSNEKVDTVVDVGDSESDGGSTEPDTSTSSDEEGAAESHAARLVSVPKALAGTRLKQHTKSRTLHLIQDGFVKAMLCGRLCGESYEPPTRVRWDTPCCSRCWRSASKMAEGGAL